MKPSGQNPSIRNETFKPIAHNVSGGNGAAVFSQTSSLLETRAAHGTCAHSEKKKVQCRPFPDHLISIEKEQRDGGLSLVCRSVVPFGDQRENHSETKMFLLLTSNFP